MTDDNDRIEELEAEVEQLREIVQEQQDSGGTSRRKFLGGVAAAGVLGASTGTASAQSGVGGGPASDEMAHLRQFLYGGSLDDRASGGVANRLYRDQADGTLYEDDGSGWSEADLGVSNLHSVSHTTEEINSIQYVTPEEHNSGERTIQDASDELAAAGITGAIMLAPNGDYVVNETQVVDASAVRTLDGNGARIRVDSDISAIKLQGSWTATSIANSYTRDEYQAEASPTITNLHIYSDQTPYIGTGIEVEGVMGPRITDCHLFHLDVDILFSSTNNIRNPIICENYIYDSDRGIVFEAGGNMHQALIHDNYIGYHRVHIHFEDCELDEPMIQSNDIESGVNSAGTDPQHYILAEPSSEFNRKTKIFENHFEHHGRMSDYAIKVDADADIFAWQIANNYLDPNGGAILVNSTTDLNGWQISNNQIMSSTGGGDRTIDISGPTDRNFAFIGNTLVNSKASFDFGTGNSCVNISNNTLELSSRMHITNGSNYWGSQICNNNAVIQQLDESEMPVIEVTGGSLTYSSVSGNSIRGQGLNNVPTGGSDQFVIDVNLTGSIWSSHIMQNTIRALGGDANGLRVASADTFQSGIIKNNMVYGANNTTFDIPASGDWVDAGVTADNLDTS